MADVKLGGIGAKLFESAVITSVFAGLIYIISYLMELGYLAYFNIGSDLAQPQYKYMLQYGPVVAGCIIGGILLVWVTILWTVSLRGRWWRLFCLIVLFALYMAIPATVIPGPDMSLARFTHMFDMVFRPLSGMLLVYACVYFVFWAAKRSVRVWLGPIRQRVYRQRVVRLAYDALAALMRRKIAQWRAFKQSMYRWRKLTVGACALCYGILLLVSFPLALGYFKGRHATAMPVFQFKGTYYIAVRQYDNYWLASEYDPATDKVRTDTYTYMPVKDMGGFELRTVNVVPHQ